MSPIRDIIITRSGYNNQHTSYKVILHKPIEFIYEEIETNFFQAECSGIFTALRYERGSSRAFAGREFQIKMKDGTMRDCKGDHWGLPPKTDCQMCSVGYQTLEGLKKCYVFYGASMRWSLIEDWLKHNTPKSEYYFYQNFPTDNEAYDKQKEWEKENNHFHYALNCMTPTHRIHSLMAIEKRVSVAERQLKSTRSNKQSVEQEYVKLVAHLVKEHGGYSTEDELTDTINEIADESGVDISVDYCDVWEELQ